jgi:hypothetical protein
MADAHSASTTGCHAACDEDLARDATWPVAMWEQEIASGTYHEPTDAELLGLAPDPWSDPPEDADADRIGAVPISPAGARFGGGGVLDGLEPGAALAGFAQDAVAGGLSQLSDDELVGVLRAWRRLASWAVAGELAAVAELSTRWQAQATAGGLDAAGAMAAAEAELACALTLTARSAQSLQDRAQALSRLPATAAALTVGVIDDFRARVIADELTGLNESQARAVEVRLLTRAGGQTTGQLRAAARRAVLAIDPSAALRRREQAERAARVEVWSEPSGTASLAGRDLPPADVLAADRRIDSLARELKRSGADGTMDQLRARVYVALLAGTSVRDLAPGRSAACGTACDPAHDTASRAARAADGVTGHGLPERSHAFIGRVNLTVPLATLAGMSAQPGEVAGFGPVDAATARGLAGSAAADPTVRWCLTLTGPDGQVIGHGCAVRRGPPGGPGPGGGRESPADAGGAGRGRLRSATGLHLVIRAGPLASGTCRHERESAGYKPSTALRHLIEVRDQTCVFPGCRRPAAQCDGDHTVAHKRGGRTCECNLVMLCRFHHKIKQIRGWRLVQAEPGVLHWVTPAGRTYAVRSGVPGTRRMQ